MRFQALFVPYSRHAFDLIQLVASVIKPDRPYLAGLAPIVKLFRLQFVMELQSPHKVFERIEPSDPNKTTNRKFRLIRAFDPSHKTLAIKTIETKYS